MSKKQNKKINNFISEDNEKAKLNLKDTTTNSRIEDSVLVKVKSNVMGTLVYKNARTGEETLWSRCGETQVLTMGDLRAMKATQMSFFSNQWVIILGIEEGYNCTAKTADIYKTLGIVKYYTNLVEPSDFTTICNWTEAQIEEKVSFMSEDAKRNLATAINEYVKSGLLDSVSKIKAFEKALGYELVKEAEEDTEN